MCIIKYMISLSDTLHTHIRRHTLLTSSFKFINYYELECILQHCISMFKWNFLGYMFIVVPNIFLQGFVYLGFFEVFVGFFFKKKNNRTKNEKQTNQTKKSGFFHFLDSLKE